MQVYAITNQKGGVAKTTSVVNLGAVLALMGKRVLLIDLDPQAHLTDGLGIKWDQLEQTVFDVLDGTAKISDVVQTHYIPVGTQTVPLYVLPSSLKLAGADLKFSMVFGREQLLRQHFQALTDFDYVLIDCPPSLGILTVNALVAAHKILIPVEPEYYAKRGITQTLEAFKEVRKLNPSLNLGGAFITKYDVRRGIHKQSEEELRQFFGTMLFKSIIRVDTSLSESPQAGMTIFGFAPLSRGAQDYKSLAFEVFDLA